MKFHNGGELIGLGLPVQTYYNIFGGGFKVWWITVLPEPHSKQGL